MATSKKADEPSSYDVFLSFKHEDTGTTFTSDLYQALEHAGIKTFIGYRLEAGESLAEQFLPVIEQSMISVVVLSTRYADSICCLEQLVKIMECRRTLRQEVFPVFYDDVCASDGNQTGHFAKAFDHEHKDRDADMVQRWRAALTEVANLPGCDLRNYRDVSSAVPDIVEHISGRLRITVLSLYCFLFPEGYEFRPYELVQMWIAEGYIKERLGERMEDTGMSYFNYLVDECFFVRSRYDYRVDFDSVFTVSYTPNNLYKIKTDKLGVLENASSRLNYFRAVDTDLDGAPATTQHLSLISQDIDEETFKDVQKLKKLRTLLLLSGESSITDVPRNLFWSLNMLRTLNLSGTLISELPSSIRNVKELRYLDVSYTPITGLPESICSLHHLQTLKFRGCVEFDRLPEGLNRLTNLRHLELDIMGQLDALPAHLGELTNLQTLSAFLVGRESGCGIGELKNLNDLRGALHISRLENVSTMKEADKASLMDKKSLHRLELEWSNVVSINMEELEEILESLKPHCGLKELQIKCYGGSKLPTWISDPSFADLVAVYLYKCKNCVLLPSIGQLRGLKILSILEMNEVKEINHQFFRDGQIDDQAFYAFPKLERLEVDIMRNLKEWQELQEGDLPSLITLIVDSCPELVTLPSLSGLNSLRHLEVKRCPKLLPSIGLPDSLESLMIIDCPQIKKCFRKGGGEEWTKRRQSQCSISFDDEEDLELIAETKSALEKAANLSGLHIPSKTVRDDSDLVDQVVKKVLTELESPSSSHSVGLVGAENRIQEILLLLCITPDDSRIRSVGIWGMGGIGKTTLANVVFHRVSSQFDACCFLANVREESETKSKLYNLRNKLLRKLIREECDSETIDDSVKRRLRRTKVLVVLDDVNDTSQLEFLAGDQVPFGPGSRIIITTRDMNQLKQMEVLREGNDHDVKVYEVQNLNNDEAMLFFCKNLTKDICSEPCFSNLSKQVVDYAGGIPLALKTWSSLFMRCKSKEGRASFWNKLKMFPDKHLQNVYKVSYDALGENEKEIFLDIACFHKGRVLSVAKQMLDACGLFSDSGIEVLVDMSLISIEQDYLWMHDVIQEFGREIVREQCPEEAGKRNRLYIPQDICHVLENNLGTGSVQKISTEYFNADLELTHPDVLTRMHNLIWLKFGSHGPSLKGSKMDHFSFPNSLRYLCWNGYPRKSLPSKFSPKNLVQLDMCYSYQLQRLWNEGQSPENLKRINLMGCRQLIQFPDLSNSKNIESIKLEWCGKLVEVPSYIWFRQKLVELNLEDCVNITNFPKCTWKLHSLTSLNLRGTSIENLPTDISEMKFLRELDVSRCRRLAYFPEILEPMEFLNILCLRYTGIKQVHESIGNLVGLKLLDLKDCKSLDSVPDGIFSLTALESLNLSGTLIESIPPFPEIGSQLRVLEVRECKRLQWLPELPYLLGRLDAFGCTSLRTVSFSMTAFTQGFDQIENCHQNAARCIEEHTFLNCPNLDENARSNIMIDAQLRIIRMAAVLSKIKDISSITRDFDPEFRHTYRECFSVSVIVPGNAISNWFPYQMEGSSIKIHLPLHWSNENFLGFALCTAGTFNPEHPNLSFECRYNFKFNNGESEGSEFRLSKAHIDWNGYDADHLFVWYYPFQLLNEDFRWSTDFYDATEASFEFYGVTSDWESGSSVVEDVNVKKCGVCLLYAQ